MLTNLSFIADEAPSGQEGIEMVRQAALAREPYDIAFVDWQMPGLDGIETGRRILALPNLDPAPHLVMVTAYGREEVLKQAEESGFENVLIKPVTSSILFDTAIGALGADLEATETVEAGLSFDIERIRGARVLLVEDNEINQEVAIGQLEEAEVFVDLAENGAEAVRMVRENDYDVVLMDMQMPVMDGIEATRILRANPRFETLPIIAMTANALVSDREMCLEAGMNDHIAKPIDPDQLFGVLLRWIRRPDGDGAGVREWIEARPAATPHSVAPVARRPARDRRHRRQVGAEANRRQPQALRDLVAPIRPPTGDHGRGHPQGAVHGGCGDGGTRRPFLEGRRRHAWGEPPVGGGRQGRDCDQDGAGHRHRAHVSRGRP